jgi:hypothetical protein
MISERERIARIILGHPRNVGNAPGACLCSPGVMRNAYDHALHVADRIQRRRED